jgi:hypothetical protein
MVRLYSSVLVLVFLLERLLGQVHSFHDFRLLSPSFHSHSLFELLCSTRC